MTKVIASIFTKLFFLGMYWRIFYGFLRILFGVALLKVVGYPLLDVIEFIGYGFTDESSDVLYHVVNFFISEQSFYVTHFLAFYFIFWGVIDILLSYNLIKEKLWAFPVSIVLIGLFVIYSITRFIFTHSLLLLSVIIIDVIILLLIYKEYQNIKEQTLPDLH
jgi:uncharacterized membrane protein